MNRNPKKAERIRRANAEWVADLSATNGIDAQTEALNELTHYLYVVVYNDLLAKQSNIAKLSPLAAEELSHLAMDFTQQFMAKLVENEFALLEKYHEKGLFTTWAAQVALNIVRSELRKVCWNRDAIVNNPFDSLEQFRLNCQQALPDAALINKQIHEVLQIGLAQLPSQLQTVFIRRMIDGESTAALASEMGVTPNTVSLMVHRAKKKMQTFLINAGIDGHGMMVKEL